MFYFGLIFELFVSDGTMDVEVSNPKNETTEEKPDNDSESTEIQVSLKADFSNGEEFEYISVPPDINDPVTTGNTPPKSEQNQVKQTDNCVTENVSEETGDSSMLESAVMLSLDSPNEQTAENLNKPEPEVINKFDQAVAFSENSSAPVATETRAELSDSSQPDASDDSMVMKRKLPDNDLNRSDEALGESQTGDNIAIDASPFKQSKFAGTSEKCYNELALSQNSQPANSLNASGDTNKQLESAIEVDDVPSGNDTTEAFEVKKVTEAPKAFDDEEKDASGHDESARNRRWSHDDLNVGKVLSDSSSTSSSVRKKVHQVRKTGDNENHDQDEQSRDEDKSGEKTESENEERPVPQDTTGSESKEENEGAASHSGSVKQGQKFSLQESEMEDSKSDDDTEEEEEEEEDEKAMMLATVKQNKAKLKGAVEFKFSVGPDIFDLGLDNENLYCGVVILLESKTTGKTECFYPGKWLNLKISERKLEMVCYVPANDLKSENGHFSFYFAASQCKDKNVFVSEPYSIRASQNGKNSSTAVVSKRFSDLENLQVFVSKKSDNAAQPKASDESSSLQNPILDNGDGTQSTADNLETSQAGEVFEDAVTDLNPPSNSSEFDKLLEKDEHACEKAHMFAVSQKNNKTVLRDSPQDIRISQSIPKDMSVHGEKVFDDRDVIQKFAKTEDPRSISDTSPNVQFNYTGSLSQQPYSQRSSRVSVIDRIEGTGGQQTTETRVSEKTDSQVEKKLGNGDAGLLTSDAEKYRKLTGAKSRGSPDHDRAISIEFKMLRTTNTESKPSSPIVAKNSKSKQFGNEEKGTTSEEKFNETVSEDEELDNGLLEKGFTLKEVLSNSSKDKYHEQFANSIFAELNFIVSSDLCQLGRRKLTVGVKTSVDNFLKFIPGYIIGEIDGCFWVRVHVNTKHTHAFDYKYIAIEDTLKTNKHSETDHWEILHGDGELNRKCTRDLQMNKTVKYDGVVTFARKSDEHKKGRVFRMWKSLKSVAPRFKESADKQKTFYLSQNLSSLGLYLHYCFLDFLQKKNSEEFGALCMTILSSLSSTSIGLSRASRSLDLLSNEELIATVFDVFLSIHDDCKKDCGDSVDSFQCQMAIVAILIIIKACNESQMFV